MQDVALHVVCKNCGAQLRTELKYSASLLTGDITMFVAQCPCAKESYEEGYSDGYDEALDKMSDEVRMLKG
jgi:hypothetical protein